MRIYKPLGSEHFEDCHPVNGDDYETLNVTLNGAPVGDTWRSPAMHMIRKDGRKKLAVSDAPWLGSKALIFRPRVIAAMGELLRDYGELLPLACNEPDLVIFNVTRVIDALDEQASTIARFPSSGRIMAIERYVFHPEIVAGVDIFKIPTMRFCPTFVSDRFVEAWTSAGLRGLDFPLVWSG